MEEEYQIKSSLTLFIFPSIGNASSNDKPTLLKPALDGVLIFKRDV